MVFICTTYSFWLNYWSIWFSALGHQYGFRSCCNFPSSWIFEAQGAIFFFWNLSSKGQISNLYNWSKCIILSIMMVGLVLWSWSVVRFVWKWFNLWQVWVLSEWGWNSSCNWFIQVCLFLIFAEPSFFFFPFFFPFRLSFRLEGIWLLKPFGMCNTNTVSMVPAISSAFLAVLQEAPRLQLWKPAKTPWGMCPNYNSNDQCMTNHGIKWFNNNDANINNKNNNATPPLRFVIISGNDGCYSLTHLESLRKKIIVSILHLVNYIDTSCWNNFCGILCSLFLCILMLRRQAPAPSRPRSLSTFARVGRRGLHLLMKASILVLFNFAF